MDIKSHEQLKALASQKTFAVYDFEFIKALKGIPWSEWLGIEKTFRIREAYISRFDEWLKSSTLNSITGLERFKSRHLINGTTQAFDELYYRYAGRRLRFFRGEYAYHRRCYANWCFIEDAPLEGQDFVIISYPFCSTGNKPAGYDEVLRACSANKIPVHIDCAYFGTCYELNIDLTAPCIESVSFSLSKGLGLGDIRSGVRYSNVDDNYPISQQNKYDHTVLAAAKIGIYMMNQFSPDFIPMKYRKHQESVCRDLKLNTTPCAHLALGDESWAPFLIDDKYYRVGIRDVVKARYRKDL